MVARRGVGLLLLRHRPPVRPAGEAPAQVAVDELLEVAVEDGEGLGGAVAGSEVEDALGRLEEVAADLVAPADGAALGAEVLEPSGSKRTFDLRELAQAAVEELTELSTLCWIPITIEGDGSAFGSPEDSRLALFNLLRNAILACRRDGMIRIRIRNNVLVIADQGHGLPPGLRKNLFNPTSHDRVFGLGATTARICQRRQGGDVRLLMPGPSGTAFGMLWPRV